MNKNNIFKIILFLFINICLSFNYLYADDDKDFFKDLDKEMKDKNTSELENKIKKNREEKRKKDLNKDLEKEEKNAKERILAKRKDEIVTNYLTKLDNTEPVFNNFLSTNPVAFSSYQTSVSIAAINTSIPTPSSSISSSAGSSIITSPIQSSLSSLLLGPQLPIIGTIIGGISFINMLTGFISGSSYGLTTDGSSLSTLSIPLYRKNY